MPEDAQHIWRRWQSNGEYVKICFLFKQVDHSDLQKPIKVLKAHIVTNPSDTVSYTTVANHWSTNVSEFPEYVPRNRIVSAVSKQGGDQDGAYKADGTIDTVYIHN